MELENYALAHAVPSAIPIYQARHRSSGTARPALNRAVNVTNGSGTLQDSQQSPGLRHAHFRHRRHTANPFVNGTSGPRFGIDTPCARAFATNTSSVNVENLSDRQSRPHPHRQAETQLPL